MEKAKRFAKCFSAILVLAALFICIWGVPLKNAKISVKAHGTSISGIFTGTWSPVKGKEGTFTAEDGWRFEGMINPDGGLWKGKLTNFPIPLAWRANSASDLPEVYTGMVEDSVLTE